MKTNIKTALLLKYEDRVELEGENIIITIGLGMYNWYLSTFSETGSITLQGHICDLVEFLMDKFTTTYELDFDYFRDVKQVGNDWSNFSEVDSKTANELESSSWRNFKTFVGTIPTVTDGIEKITVSYSDYKNRYENTRGVEVVKNSYNPDTKTIDLIIYKY